MNFAKGKPPGKGNPRVDFDVDAFRHQIWGHGWRLTWEQAELCPCRESAESDAGRRGCPVCGASGWIWHTPTEIRAIVMAVSEDEDTMHRIGPWLSGRVSLTLQPEHLPGRFDRYTAIESVMVMREIAVRPSSGVTSPLKLPIARRTLVLDAGTVTVGVHRARAILASGVASSTALVEGVDFDVTDAGLLDWTKGDGLGTAPALGARFSVTYTAHPIFEVDDVAYAVRDTRIASKAATPVYAPMQVKAMARLKMSA